MNKRIILVAMLLVPVIAHTQPVHIPDPNLRAAISEALNGDSMTPEAMRQLVHLGIAYQGITELTGIEFATELESIFMWGNPTLSDITPFGNLAKLRELHASGCGISNLTPLAQLTELEVLSLLGNPVSDITPLRNLKKLRVLNLAGGDITDVRPLAGLTSLEVLHISGNNVVDHSPLNGLSLTDFVYDQTCNMPPLPLQPRLENRTFPSVFAAWGGIGWSSVLNQPHLSDLEQMAQHDLYFCCLMFDQEFLDVGNGWEVRGPLDSAIQIRDDYTALNPNMVFLVEIRAVWENLGTFPEDSPYWARDAQGQILPAWDSGLVDLSHPDVQKRIVDKAVAVSQCGLYDGIFFDGWNELYGRQPGDLPAMATILRTIRDRVRSDFIIMVNTNRYKTPVSMPYINGLFLESGVPFDGDVEVGLSLLEDTLLWADDNLRSPQINGLEGFGFPDEPMDSPNNLRWMRAITTLVLTFSDGYTLYIDPTRGAHGHYWYDFWDADLGRPVGPKAQLYEDAIPNLYLREYTNGWAVYNHSGKAQVIMLPEEVKAVASGLVNTEHALPNLDGEMYLKVTVPNPADVNKDGVVNILDLTIVARAFGTDKPEGDTNGDGVVNVFDLVFVANRF